MKKTGIAIIIVLSSFVSRAQFTSVNLTAAGLTCAMCTKAIYNALEKIPGVDKVDTDIKNSAFVIFFRQGADIDPDQLKKAVDDAGFSVSKFQLTGNFKGEKIAPDAHVSIDNKMFHFLKVRPSSLEGKKTLTLVDKGFTDNREFKKYAASTSYSCIQTGKREKCCEKNGIAKNTRIYHVTL